MPAPASRHAAAWSGEEEGATYERGRPDYPAAATDVLAERLGLGPGRVLVDVAAGTGKLTRSLTGTGARIVAVEPMAGMRMALRAAVTDVGVVAGTAEALPLRSGTADALTVAQAFHWFDVGPATAELHRVLRPGGRLAVVDNRRDDDAGWMADVTAILHRYQRLVPRPAGVRRWRDDLLASPYFTGWELVEVPHEQRFASRDDFDARFTSVSSVILLPESRRAEMVTELRHAVRAVEPLVMPMHTTIRIATRAAGGESGGGSR